MSCGKSTGDLPGSCCGCRHSEVVVREYRVGTPSLLDLPLDWTLKYGQSEQLADQFGQRIQDGIYSILVQHGVDLIDTRGVDILSRIATEKDIQTTEHPMVFITCNWDETKVFTWVNVVNAVKLFVDDLLQDTSLQHTRVTVEMVSPDLFAF